MLGRIAEVHVVEVDLALELGVGDRAILVRVLPGPEVGALVRLLERAILGALGIDKRDIAVVLFRLLVEKREDALGTGKAHDDEVDLMGDLADRSCEALREVQERDDDVDTQNHAGDRGVRDAGDKEDAACEGDDYVGKVARVHEDGAKGVAVDVRVLRGLEELLVHLVEVSLGQLLMREDLDDLLAVHGFLGKAFLGRKSTLLRQEEVGRAAAEHTCQGHHDCNHDQDDKRQRHGIPEHDVDDRDHGNDGRQEVRERLTDELAQGIHVVRVVRHDVAVLVGVEVADREVLHVREHLVPDLHHRALADDGAKLRPADVAGKGGDVASDERKDDAQNLGLRRCPVAGLERVLDDGDGLLHEDRRHRGDDGGCHDAEGLDGHEARVVVEDKRHDALERCAGILCTMAAARCLLLLGCFLAHFVASFPASASFSRMPIFSSWDCLFWVM